MLLDISLNDLNGIEVLEELRQYDKETKVVIITGQMYADEEIQRISNFGISGYRHKPLVLEEVEKLVYQALDNKQLLRITKPAKKKAKKAEGDPRAIVHSLSNLLGIVRNKCENFILNIEDGVYEDKSPEELVEISVEIMKEIEETVDRSMGVVEQINENKK